MHPIRFAKTSGAHFVAAWLAAAALACDSPAVIFEPLPVSSECTRIESADGARRDTPLPPDGTAADSGPSRSLFCGTTGCFPGNWNACGPTPHTGRCVSLRFTRPTTPPTRRTPRDRRGSRRGHRCRRRPGSTDAKNDTCDDVPHDASLPDASSPDTSSPDISIDGSAPDAAGRCRRPSLRRCATTPTMHRPSADVATTDSGGRADAAVDMGRRTSRGSYRAATSNPRGDRRRHRMRAGRPGAAGQRVQRLARMRRAPRMRRSRSTNRCAVQFPAPCRPTA